MSTLSVPNTTASIPIAKRITGIKLINYRAYYSEYEQINLDKGENLLIYGENGSGKSSLFKAINNFLASSADISLPYTKNRYQLEAEGKVIISIGDFEKSNLKKIDASVIKYEFGSVGSTNSVSFIQNSSLIKGFLDYRDLLDVYFHREPNPNLFPLIVLSLLGSHVPVSSGGNFKFKEKWDELQKDLIDKAYTRESRCHKNAKKELPIFQTHLVSMLSEVFGQLNIFLTKYFPDLKIELWYELKDIDFIYEYFKSDWHTINDLRLKVTKDGVPIDNDYSDILNEARLSAFTICLYLASLKRNPGSVDFKILYLDDIFIGLDTSNRIPILNILREEFSDYQIFISSYDRHTFLMAKQYFENLSPRKWSSVELYVGQDSKGEINFDKPIIVQNESDFAIAIRHLHNTFKPDYPAAANYFRKYSEKILTSELPTHEIRKEDFSLIEDYKLGKLVSAGLYFLNKVRLDNSLLLNLRGALSTLLHPLSHSDVNSPVYKRELLDIQKCLTELHPYLKSIKINCKPFLTPSKIVRLKFPISESCFGCYEIQINEMVYLLKNGAHISLSKGNCRAIATYKQNGDIKDAEIKLPQKRADFRFDSLQNAYDRIFDFLKTNLEEFNELTKVEDFTTQYEIFTDSWNSLDNSLIW